MSATAQQLPTGTYAVDVAHSSVGFSVKHLGIKTFRAGFDEVEAQLADGVLTGRVPVASIQITNPDFKAHVLAEDFFDAERTPDVAFRSTAIDLADDGTATVQGELTIKGTTQPVTATGTIAGPVTNPYGKQVLAVELDAAVDRTAFGLRWNMDMPSGGKVLGEKVTLHVELELVEA